MIFFEYKSNIDGGIDYRVKCELLSIKLENAVK